MHRFYFSHGSIVFHLVAFFFVFSLPAHALLGSSSQSSVLSSPSSTANDISQVPSSTPSLGTSPSATSTKNFLIQQPKKTSLGASSSSTSTQVKIVKPKPIQISAPPKARIQDVFIPDQYIVVLKNITSTDPLSGIIKKYSISPMFQYKKIFKGFSAKLDAKKRELLKKDTRVEFIAEDRVVSILAAKKQKIKKQKTKKHTTKKSPSKKSKAKKSSPLPLLTTQPFTMTSSSSTLSMTTSTSPTSTISVSLPIIPLDPKKVQVIPTGIARTLAQSATIHGAGIGIAVLDTGIDRTHPDLKKHIIADTTCVRGTKNGNDDNGHGTHGAGIIGALDNTFGVVGVASEAHLISVKVLDVQGMGTWSSVLCGIEWMMNNATKYTIKVANMGFGGAGISDNNCGMTNNDPLHQALCQSTQSGITYIVAAGNESADIATIVPAAYTDTVITVSALVDTDGAPNGKGHETTVGEDDTFATFSNFGMHVILGAPGINILSTGKNGTYYSASGTSMAAAHVAGAAALYIQSHPGVRWTDIKTALLLSGEHQGVAHTDFSGNHPEVALQVLVF